MMQGWDCRISEGEIRRELSRVHGESAALLVLSWERDRNRDVFSKIRKHSVPEPVPVALTAIGK
jgi:hypothetical protein